MGKDNIRIAKTSNPTNRVDAMERSTAIEGKRDKLWHMLNYLRQEDDVTPWKQFVRPKRQIEMEDGRVVSASVIGPPFSDYIHYFTNLIADNPEKLDQFLDFVTKIDNARAEFQVLLKNEATNNKSLFTDRVLDDNRDTEKKQLIQLPRKIKDACCNAHTAIVSLLEHRNDRGQATTEHPYNMVENLEENLHTIDDFLTHHTPALYNRTGHKNTYALSDKNDAFQTLQSDAKAFIRDTLFTAIDNVSKNTALSGVQERIAMVEVERQRLAEELIKAIKEESSPITEVSTTVADVKEKGAKIYKVPDHLL